MLTISHVPVRLLYETNHDRCDKIAAMIKLLMLLLLAIVNDIRQALLCYRSVALTAVHAR